MALYGTRCERRLMTLELNPGLWSLLGRSRTGSDIVSVLEEKVIFPKIKLVRHDEHVLSGFG